ncbi:MAG TPA: hypothetical protein DEF30_04680 [Proteiniclasticum sp.]|uniref:DUF2971 domain-containing protein n=1 Tax=Proteiniclasticum sp. TaxID=2053595 RepID=UPI000E8821E0|nr:DUF2971 domain-containing protein [Proteiniclasticum sp.]HBW13098.1 hypothetical protein [Proteiniclasticum sp.]
MSLNNKNLYHFTSVDTLLNYILKYNRLKFNNLYNMNDPKEASSWPFKFYDEVTDTSYLRINSSIFEEIDRYVKSYWLIACFKNEPHITYETDINEFDRAYFDMRMWDQYGDKHKGICIIFDHEKLMNSLSKLSEFNVFHGSVTYSNNYFNKMEDPFAVSFHQISLHGLNEIMKNQTMKYYDNFFFTKSLSWRGEDEYRIALHFKEKEVEYYLHDFKDAITGIILGYQVSEEIQKDIFELFGDKLNIYRILSNNWHNEIVKIDNENHKEISLNGIYFSTVIPANYFVLKAQNLQGDPKLVFINSSGEVKILE